jgi:hypothetical protein
VFVLQDTRTGKYVTWPGADSSFTWKLRHARVYATAEEAERDQCPESERIIDLDRELRP